MGIVLPSRSLFALEGLARVAGDAERAGLDIVYLNESGNDALTASAAILGRTTTIGVGTGIVNIGTRHPFVVGMAAAELESFAPGRFRLGLGVGSATFNLEALGQSLAQPISRLAEYVTVVRGIALGTLVDHPDGFYPVLRVDRHAPPVVSVAIDAAALRPTAVERLAPLVDGFVVNFVTPAILRDLIGRALKARHGQSHNRFTAYVQLVTGGAATPGEVQRAAANLVGLYAVHAHYRRAFATAGFEDEVVAMQRARERGLDVADSVPEYLWRAMIAADDPAPIANALAEAGADTIVLYPTPADRDWDRSFTQAIAQANALRRSLNEIQV